VSVLTGGVDGTRSGYVDMSGWSALISGGASGLGAATSRALAAQGVRVVIADIKREQAEALADELEGIFVYVDVNNDDLVREAVEAARTCGSFRMLVNCAGVGLASRTVGRDGEYSSAHSMSDFSRVIATNLFGTFNMVRYGATAMVRNEPDADGSRGAIVNTSSIAAFDGQTGQVAYASAKAAIAGMTLPLARELSSSGIRVNAIAPGLFDTPIYGTGPRAEEMKTRLGRDVLFPARMGYSSEFASMVVALLTNPYMNAEVVRLDAGLRMPAKSARP
jgi:NAD(P)-dependent dehydrogenase (short-subunit alcohol dehydrogenase family)